MTYDQAVAWIHDQLKFGMKPGIKRMTWLLEQFDNPQKELKAVHVVGTNGKGSTVNYLQEIFSQAGYQVGTFTSPYLMDFRERISLNGQMISKKDLLFMVDLVKPIVERLPKETSLGTATEFEIITLIMILYFSRYQIVDIAIIEAGLGGRYDSTNVFQALAVVCPSIGLDHQEILGQTYADIAAEKAAVLKNGEPFIFATDKEEVRTVFQTYAKKSQSPLFELGLDFSYELKGKEFDFTSDLATLSNLSLNMLGQHQVANASLALMTSLILQQSYPKLSLEIVRQALAQAKWAGRLEMIEDNLMLDGAHNQESVAALVTVLKETYDHRPIHILFAAIANKPVEKMLEALSIFNSLTVTSFDFDKALPLSAYPSTYTQVMDFRTWLNRHQSDPEALYVVTGSLYFISQVRKLLVKGK
ncbi:folylpolyglutamate synthase/dihydrofolate synthase family protein [Streptococcus sp. sy004]|uniref:bifunctional folylpolyglutamate synthase/dihydrofolate synthase n=1 Tax=Streptococcus sp. sy004 TaxID=2600149 RepID=UPI0011B43952|nr:folylpolyglutamate synthase/dihydrofolate synthase family protein [Streptococcus sp. sy004]TWT12464.1 bifunctional folylpolyglutamate synthase/dihydrofolate synthase [Streptococcus sp. sy004]